MEQITIKTEVMTKNDYYNYFKNAILKFQKELGKKLEESELIYCVVMSGVEPILEEDDGCDGDLYCGVISHFNSHLDIDAWCKFYINCNAKTHIVNDVDLTCVDISINDTIFDDCVNLENFNI